MGTEGLALLWCVDFSQADSELLIPAPVNTPNLERISIGDGDDQTQKRFDRDFVFSNLERALRDAGAAVSSDNAFIAGAYKF